MIDHSHYQRLDRRSVEALNEAWREGGPGLWEEYGCGLLSYHRHATRALFVLREDGTGLASSDPTACPVERERQWFSPDQPGDAGEVLALLASGAICVPEVSKFYLDELPARLIESAAPATEKGSIHGGKTT